MWTMAWLPFEHDSKFGVVLQFISCPNRTLALDQLYNVVGKKLILALSIGWVQDRAFLEIHPCWLESANAHPDKPEEMSLYRWVGQVLSWKGSYCVPRSPVGFGGS